MSGVLGFMAHHWTFLGGGALIGIGIAFITALGPAAVLGMLKIVPRWGYEVLIALVLVLAYGAYRHSAGEAVTQAKWDAEKREQATYVAKVADKQGQVLRQTVTQYVDREHVVRIQGETITKQVPIYVTAQNDTVCTINNGFVRLWNAANTGVQLPDIPAGTDGQASGVKLSDVETQHVAESTYARGLEVQLIKLQDAVSEVTAAGKGFAP
ncbi:MAG: hypothetical protein ABI171_16150 [Collimonas sp.]|uniref:hypothetical protein n=1 Tax=Collimonas sp. TaxID=1963772 RepID=UPI00326505E2